MGHRKPTRAQNAGRVARRAAQIIKDRGHAVGSMETRDGKVCAIRAFQLALKPVRVSTSMYISASLHAGRTNQVTDPTQLGAIFTDWLEENHPDTSLSRSNGCGVPAWNDHVLKEETLQWLEKFADEMDPQ